MRSVVDVISTGDAGPMSGIGAQIRSDEALLVSVKRPCHQRLDAYIECFRVAMAGDNADHQATFVSSFDDSAVYTPQDRRDLSHRGPMASPTSSTYAPNASSMLFPSGATGAANKGI